MQLFTKQASRWAERECAQEESSAFVAAVSDSGVNFTTAHDSYLINLASPDVALRARSLNSFAYELGRCEALRIDYLVSHPGNFIDDRASGIERNAEAISEGLSRVPGRTTVLLETTAGCGTAIGSTFEELAILIGAVDASVRARVGICVDTAHIFAAGYDLISDFDGIWSRFSDTVGWSSLHLLHLNDSKVPLGSRRDRHELIGEGAIGADPFRRIMTNDRLAPVAKVIETPKLNDAEATDRRMLSLLRSFAE